jgi:hypothetical protein
MPMARANTKKARESTALLEFGSGRARPDRCCRQLFLRYRELALCLQRQTRPEAPVMHREEDEEGGVAPPPGA